MAFSKSEFQAFCTQISRIGRIFSVFHGEFRVVRAIRVQIWFLSSDNEKTIEQRAVLDVGNAALSPLKLAAAILICHTVGRESKPDGELACISTTRGIGGLCQFDA